MIRFALSCLAAARVFGQTALVTLNAVLGRLDLTAAIEKELSSRNRLMPTRHDRFSLAHSAGEVEKWLRPQLRKGIYGSRASTVFVDKSRRGARPISEFSLADRVLYRALVELIAQSLPSHLTQRSTIAEFHEDPLRDTSVRYVSKTDVTAYYEFVDHELLEDELLSQTGEEPAITALMGLLERIMGRSVGLPQVHKSSDILGDTYIDLARRRLNRAGYSVFTFSDDFRIGSTDLASARSALEACAVEVRALGLVLNESKTYTYGADKYRRSLTSFVDAEKRLFEQADSDSEGLSLLYDSDYDDPDDVDDSPANLSLGSSPVHGRIDEDEAIVDTDDSDRTGEVPDPLQVAAAESVWQMWIDEDESDETQSGQDTAITQSLLGRALPILGTAGDKNPLDKLSALLRHEPALTPQIVKYILRYCATGPRARTGVRAALDRVTAEDNFSAWQYMWLAEAAGGVRRAPKNLRRAPKNPSHYDWLAWCVEHAQPPLAATAAASLGSLRVGRVKLLEGALDRVGEAWRPLVLWGLAQLDMDAATACADSKLDRILIESIAT
jgi:Reverse transcriptase (RNA-dependent DNA polymerase)